MTILLEVQLKVIFTAIEAVLNSLGGEVGQRIIWGKCMLLDSDLM